MFSAALVFSIAGCMLSSLPSAGYDAPGSHVIRASQYAFTTDFPLDRTDEMVDDLVRMRSQFCDLLKLPASRNLIRVTIFESQQRFEEHFRRNFPDLPHRRAFFVKQGDDLLVFARKGPAMREDLRHEATHALLHSTMPNVPIWLDEGLAEYFEKWSDAGSVRAEHVQRLLAAASPMSACNWNLTKLEGKRDLWQMSAADYRESWLWIHFCLRGPTSAAAALVDHVAALRAGKTESLALRLKRLGFDDIQTLRRHLDRQVDLPEIHMADNPLTGANLIR